MLERRSISVALVVLGILLPCLGGAKGCGDSPAFSRSAAPDLQGSWGITYDDTLGVEIGIGGSVYTQTLTPSGGTFTIMHAGVPITFNLDCSRPEVVCPNETWPTTVSIVQRNATYPHRMFVQIPQQYCTAMEVTPAPADCGAGTLNPDCEPVCSGEVATRVQEAFGVIDEAGTRFDLLLGAGVATNGVNCALLGVSSASASLVTTGSADTGDWRASEMRNGQVAVAYAGGCLWARDAGSGSLEAVILSASVKFTTGFSAARLMR